MAQTIQEGRANYCFNQPARSSNKSANNSKTTAPSLGLIQTHWSNGQIPINFSWFWCSLLCLAAGRWYMDIKILIHPCGPLNNPSFGKYQMFLLGTGICCQLRTPCSFLLFLNHLWMYLALRKVSDSALTLRQLNCRQVFWKLPH